MENRKDLLLKEAYRPLVQILEYFVGKCKFFTIKTGDSKEENVAKRLRLALKEAGIRNRELAREFGVTTVTISRWFSGERRIGTDILAQLYQKYGISPLFVISGEGPILIKRDSPGVDLPEWERGALAIWRLYWALREEKNPKTSDLAIVAMLYLRESDPFSAAEKLTSELKKNWQIVRVEISEISEKEISPFQKASEEKVAEPIKSLCRAAFFLVDLTKRGEFPKTCLSHSEIYWQRCSWCERSRNTSTP